MQHRTVLNGSDYRTPNERNAYSVLRLCEEHKQQGCDGECGIQAYPLRDIVTELLDRSLTVAESSVLM